MSLKQADLPLRTRHLIDEFIAPDSLDYVVCSHVAEHVPDLIGWLKANAKVLRKGGALPVPCRPPGAATSSCALYKR